MKTLTQSEISKALGVKGTRTINFETPLFYDEILSLTVIHWSVSFLTITEKANGRTQILLYGTFQREENGVLDTKRPLTFLYSRQTPEFQNLIQKALGL